MTQVRKEDCLDVESGARANSVPEGQNGNTRPGSMIERLDDSCTTTVPIKVAFVTFFLFAVAEIIGAVMTGSLSLLGDAASMLVDTLAYALNAWAEERKPHAKMIRKVELEIVPPAVSVFLLTAVTIYITVASILTIDSISNDANNGDGDTKERVMFGYALANLFLDVMNIAVFAFRPCLDRNSSRLAATLVILVNGGGGEGNLNMCSAWAHVVADTMRTLAVLIAATISHYDQNTNPDEADAWAALFVSIIVILSIVPLIQSLCEKASVLRRLRAKEGRSASIGDRSTVAGKSSASVRQPGLLSDQGVSRQSGGSASAAVDDNGIGSGDVNMS